MKSYSEPTALICPHCAHSFDAPIWLIIDVHEHAELLDAIRMEQINMVACPSCGHRAAVPAPLLLHDSVLKCLLFLIPPETDEATWRQQGEALHRLLINNIPVDQRQPYLDNVIFVEKIGEAVPLLLKMGRNEAQRIEPKAQDEPSPAISSEPVATGYELLYAAVEEAVLAATPEQIKKILHTYPVLSDPANETVLAELTEAAFAQQEFTLVQRLQSLRRTIRDSRRSDDSQTATIADSPTLPLPPPLEQAGDPQERLHRAVDLLLTAPDHDAIAQILVDYPLVLSDDALSLLKHIAMRARERGDTELATYALEYCDFLRQVREGLDSPSTPSR